MMTPSVVTRTISMQTEFNPFKTVRLSQESNDSTVVRLEVDGGCISVLTGNFSELSRAFISFYGVILMQFRKLASHV